MYSPLTWGIHEKPPVDIPECGFVGELCPPPVLGKSLRSLLRSVRNNKAGFLGYKSSKNLYIL